MSLASNKLLKTIYTNENPNDKQVRIGVIIGRKSVGSHSRFSVRFNGEEEGNPNKYYDIMYGSASQYSDGVKVMLTKINGTYIITGRLY